MEIRQLTVCVLMILTTWTTSTRVLGHPVDSASTQDNKKRLHRYARSVLDSTRERREKLEPINVLKMLRETLSGTDVKDSELATILDHGLKKALEDSPIRDDIYRRLFRKLEKKLQDSNPPPSSVARSKVNGNGDGDDGENDDDDYHISTVVRTWSKNDSGQGVNDVISGYKTEVNKTKRAGRLSINGALTSLADLLLSENERRDRAETMQLRQRLQFLG